MSAPMRLPTRAVAALGAVVAVVLSAGCAGTPAGRTGTPTSRPASTTTSTSTTTPPASTTTPPGTVKASLAVVGCTTTYGVPLPSTSAPLHTSVEVSIPGTLADDLAVYSDDRGFMMLLGPKGWTCRAAYGADGSGGVVVSPRGEAVPEAWGAGWHLSAGSSAEAIIGSETSACQGCGVGQACPLFAAAAREYQSEFGRACPQSRPTSESVEQLGPGVVAFQDPPDLVGDGNPSGGQDPANGVMTYYPMDNNGSWIATCTLPGTEHAICTSALDAFISWYGRQ